MKKALFTICAKNYLGLARALGEAVKRYAKEVDFYVFLADECGEEIVNEVGYSTIISRDVLNISPDIWESMSYKYNLVEFCTALKPACFSYVMNKGYDKVIYADPDIFFFSDFDFIYDQLDEYMAILTPHEIHPHRMPSHARLDYKALRSGIYNLGFAAFRNTDETREVMDWWQNRLEDYAVSEVTDGLFTDQKWMDFLPSLMPNASVMISRNPGMNCAPWNYHEREVLCSEQGFSVRQKYEQTGAGPLIFFHCAGYDYRLLLGENPQSYYLKTHVTPDIAELLKHCSDRLKRNGFESYLSLPYTYGSYSNGDQITYFQRRMYRRLNNEGYRFTKLFDAQGDLYQLLKHNALITKEPVVAEKAQPSQIQGFGKKLLLIDLSTRLVKKVFGPYRYVLFCKLLNKYYRYENQVRLLDKKYKHITIR